MPEWWEIAIAVALVAVGLYGLRRCRQRASDLLLTFKVPHGLSVGDYARLTDKDSLWLVTCTPDLVTVELKRIGECPMGVRKEIDADEV